MNARTLEDRTPSRRAMLLAVVLAVAFVLLGALGLRVHSGESMNFSGTVTKQLSGVVAPSASPGSADSVTASAQKAVSNTAADQRVSHEKSFISQAVAAVSAVGLQNSNAPDLTMLCALVVFATLVLLLLRKPRAVLGARVQSQPGVRWFRDGPRLAQRQLRLFLAVSRT